MSAERRPEGPGKGEASGEPGAELKRAVRRRGSFVQTFKAVGWSFFGVRRSADYEKDLNEINPVHVVIAGVIGALVFICALVVLVGWVTGGVAA
jgi:DUF2970 family protein